MWIDDVRTHSAPVNLFVIKLMNINQLHYSNALYDLMLMSTDGKNEDLASWEAFIRPAQDSRFKYLADEVNCGKIKTSVTVKQRT